MSSNSVLEVLLLNVLIATGVALVFNGFVVIGSVVLYSGIMAIIYITGVN